MRLDGQWLKIACVRKQAAYEDVKEKEYCNPRWKFRGRGNWMKLGK